MSRFDFEKFDASVVVLGSLNPAIATPDWLRRKGLITDSDFESAIQTIQASAPQGIFSFSCDWFALNAIPQKLSVLTKQGSSPRVRDLVAGVFQYLGETPVTAVGVNFHADIKFHQPADYYLFGDVLAPKGVWHSEFPAEKFAVGVKSLTMEIREGPRQDGYPSEISPNFRMLTIEPSAQSVGVVSMRLNIHIQFGEGANGADLAKLLLADWEKHEAVSKDFLLNLVANTLGGR